MKNFFEFFGFLSTACISAALIFIFIGKKDDLGRDSKPGFLTEMGAEAESLDAPRSISEHPMRSNKIAGSKRDRAVAPEESKRSEMAAETQLKSLYNDQSFIASTAKHWKGIVQDAADEYNVKPQVLLAHLIVQSYLGDYTRDQLYRDAAKHAGERLKPVSSAIKGYRFGWTMQKLINEQDLLRYFPEERSVAAAAVSNHSSERMVTNKNVASKGMTKASAPIAKNSPVEEGFKNMVAKEYGFGSWAGLQKLADPDTKAEAARRVKSLIMASKVR